MIRFGAKLLLLLTVISTVTCKPGLVLNDVVTEEPVTEIVTDVSVTDVSMTDVSMTDVSVTNVSVTDSAVEEPVLLEQLSFAIKTTWNGESIPESNYVNIILEKIENSSAILFRIDALFYDDPPPNGTVGEPFFGLWDYEVVEIFFLNDQDRYLEVKVGPGGQHIVLLVDGERNVVRHSLPLNVTTKLDSNRWSGEALIPADYFPPQVSKFNAYAINGVEGNRRYLALYPANSTATAPDFHKLKLFQPIDMGEISPAFVKANTAMSSLWESAISGQLPFTIKNTWNGESIPESNYVNISLERIEKSSAILFRIEALFYNDPPPNGTAGEPFRGLWNYEVVEVFFLNDQDQYLQVEVGPGGQHFVLLLNGKWNAVRSYLPLNVTTKLNSNRWSGEAIIPAEYFPHQVSKFNAYAINGAEENRRYLALYPANSTATAPDFHKLKLFQPIDMGEISPAFVKANTAMSSLWESAISGRLPFTIKTTWNGESIPESNYVNISLERIEKSSAILFRIDALFYDDPPTNGTAGEPFLGLWNYEVVDVFFLNDQDQYTQVEVGPGGQHIVVLSNGERNTVRFSLPLNVTTKLDSNRWSGEAIIPAEYFPPQVSKFNAYAISGVEENRRYLALYPANSTATAPDFHNIKLFKPIDMGEISPAFVKANIAMSSLWESAISGQLPFTIKNTWNGDSIPESNYVNIILERIENSSAILFRMDALFYDDPPPNGTAGEPFLGLWDYEVVEVFFLNDQDQYLEVEVGPGRQHIVLLLNGERNTVRHSLPLNVTTKLDLYRWSGEAIIPAEYFPPQVSKFNAYAINGVEKKRRYLALYPANSTASGPDFHNLKLFQPIDMGEVSPAFVKENTAMTSLWESAISGIFQYKITKLWNDFSTDISPTEVSLQGFEGGVEANFTMPLNAEDTQFPARYFTIVFENDEGEALKIKLYLDGSSFVYFMVKRNEVMESEDLPVDYRVDTEGKTGYAKGSALILPSYFPPKVTLVNMYSVFGYEKSVAMTLRPIDTFDNLVFKPELKSKDHFRNIDFDMLVQSNSDYSNVWRKLLILPLLPEEIKVNKRKTDNEENTQVRNPSSQIKDSSKVTTVEPNKQSEETTDDQPEEAKPEINEPVKVSQTAETNVSVENQQQESTSKTDVKANDNDKEVSISETKPPQESEMPSEVKSNTTDTQADHPIPELQTDLMNNTQEADKAMVTNTTLTQESETDDNIKTNEQEKKNQNEKEVVTQADEEKKSEIDINPNESENKEESNTESNASETVSGTDNLDKVEVTTEVPQVKIITEPEENQATELSPTKVTTELENNQTIDATPIEHIVKTSRNGQINFNKPLRYLLRRNPQDMVREEYQRRYEESNSDKNELPITFEITMKSEENNNNQDILSDLFDHKSPKIETNQFVEQKQKQKIEQLEEHKIKQEIEQLEQKQKQGIEQLLQLKGEELEQALEKQEQEENVTEGSLLEDNTQETDVVDLSIGILPPPHPICFIEGLVPDDFRCQVFYECVIENGRWEMYRWRCKRGFYYDAEKVACLRGYC